MKLTLSWLVATPVPFTDQSLVTRDIDICACFVPSTINKLREVLKEHHLVHRQTPNKLSFLEHPQDIKSLRSVYLDTNLGVLDIISTVTGVGDFERVKTSARLKFPCLAIDAK